MCVHVTSAIRRYYFGNLKPSFDIIYNYKKAK